MLGSLDRVGLETTDLATTRRFYEETLDLDVTDSGPTHVAYAAGEQTLILRAPAGVPRGGVHTHYAFSIPRGEYDDWWDRLSGDHDLEEARFGDARSLYCVDPAGHCVELGQRDVPGPGIDGIFEVVLEVRDLERARSLYAALGFETVSEGAERPRVRMHGPVDLELWEPHLGIADAQGGLHVDLGFVDADLPAVATVLEERACELERTDGRLRAIDPDGHHLVVTGSDP